MTFPLFVYRVSRVNAAHLTQDFASSKNSSSKLIERKLRGEYEVNIKKKEKKKREAF